MTLPTIIEFADNDLLVIRLSGSVDSETLQVLATGIKPHRGRKGVQ